MKLQNLTLFLFAFFYASITSAQTFEGVWKGTSLCQVKNSPCHDETVVYYISKDSTGSAYEIKAYKIINEEEDFMGTLFFNFDKNQNVYVSIDKDRGSKWEFTIIGNTMKGTLVSKGILYRIIDVRKENP